MRSILLTLLFLLGLAVPTARSELPRCDDARDLVGGAEWTLEHDDSRAEAPAIPAGAATSMARSAQPRRIADGGWGLLGEGIHRWDAFEVAGVGTVSDRRAPAVRDRRSQPESRGPPEAPTAA